MRIRTPLLVIAAAATMLAGVALPASAAGTTTDFNLAAGFLSANIPTEAHLTTDNATGLGTTTVGAHDVVGSLGNVTVYDARGADDTSWSATAYSTVFDLADPVLRDENGTSGPSITSSTKVNYAHGNFTALEGVTEADNLALSAASQDLTTSSVAALTVVRATGLTGGNSATWTPSLTVTMPATARAGAYSGTVTTSVA